MADIDPILFIIIGTIIMIAILVLFRVVINTASRRWNKHKAGTVLKWESEGVRFVRGPVGGSFGGLESMGINRVIRGIGFIALTDQDLRVTRSIPEAVWCINFKQIKGVTIQPAFLGKRGKTPFIVVRFVKDGAADKLAFQVGAYQAWAGDLAQAAGVSVKVVNGP